MSWEGSPAFRWVKMYRGERHRVSCADLGLARDLWTREGSYRQANAWWVGKRATLDAPPPHPHEATLKELAERLDWARGHGLADEAAEIEAHAEAVRGMGDELNACEEAEPDPPGADRLLEMLRLFGWNGPPLDPVVLRALLPSEHVWADRMRREPDAPKDRTVGWWCDKWLAGKVEEAAQGVRASSGLRLLRYAVGHFKTFVGADSPLTNINAHLWERWGVLCQGRVALRDSDPKAGWAADYAKKVYSLVRGFLKWLWQQGAVDSLPRNLDRRVKFDRPAAGIKTYSNAEVKTLLDAAKGQHRLHILLALNTGMNPADIAHLQRAEVDLTNGRITRRRHKTRRQKHTPLVCYPLWPLTLKLLREHIEREGALALRTPRGRPWATVTTQKDGKERECNCVRNYHRALCQRTGLGGGFKTFRNTSATRLRANPKYADLRHHFLGHSGKSMADRHYAEVDQALFNEAVAWLGRQYALAD
jgi:integrase